MNKNYIKSLINEMFDRNILNSEEERAEVKELIKGLEERDELTGNFDEDLDYLIEEWNDYKADVAHDVSSEIEETVNNLHIGFNFIPGIGIGYCKDEEDLEKMKNFVRGGMAVEALLESLLGL